MLRDYVLRNNVLCPLAALFVGATFQFAIAPALSIPFGFLDLFLLIFGAFIVGTFLDYFLTRRTGGVAPKGYSVREGPAESEYIQVTSDGRRTAQSFTFAVTEKPQEVRLQVLHRLKDFTFEITESQQRTLLRLHLVNGRGSRSDDHHSDHIMQKHAQSFQVAVSTLVPGLKLTPWSDSSDIAVKASPDLPVLSLPSPLTQPSREPVEESLPVEEGDLDTPLLVIASEGEPEPTEDPSDVSLLQTIEPSLESEGIQLSDQPTPEVLDLPEESATGLEQFFSPQVPAFEDSQNGQRASTPLAVRQTSDEAQSQPQSNSDDLPSPGPARALNHLAVDEGVLTFQTMTRNLILTILNSQGAIPIADLYQIVHEEVQIHQISFNRRIEELKQYGYVETRQVQGTDCRAIAITDPGRLSLEVNSSGSKMLEEDRHEGERNQPLLA